MSQSLDDKNWAHNDQKEVYRHRVAMQWLTKADEPILDLGCGDGFLMRKLQDKGFAVWGGDFSKTAVDKCRAAGLDVEQIDIVDIEKYFPLRQAKTIILLDILEHVFEPLVLLASLNIVSETLIISVPNFASLPARLQVLRGVVPENNYPRRAHVYWFTYRVLMQALSDTGWEVEKLEVNTVWMSVPAIGLFMRLLGKINPSLFGLSFLVRAKNNRH